MTTLQMLSIDARNAIADEFADRLRDRVECLEPSGARRWWRVEETDSHDVWLIDWPAGAIVPRHDHDGAAASIAVIRGELVETRYDAAGVEETSTLAPGPVHVVADEISHEIRNVAGAVATSVHVYSPPLRAMSFYDDAGALAHRDVVDG